MTNWVKQILISLPAWCCLSRSKLGFPWTQRTFLKLKITNFFWKYVHNKIEFWISTIVNSTTDQSDPLSSSASSNYLLRYRQCFERNQGLIAKRAAIVDCHLVFIMFMMWVVFLLSNYVIYALWFDCNFLERSNHSSWNTTTSRQRASSSRYDQWPIFTLRHTTKWTMLSPMTLT